MRLPDWLVYTVVLIVIVGALFLQGGEGEDVFSTEPAIVATPDASTPRDLGPLLPEPTVLDEKVLVQVGDPEDGIGTAFAINKSGLWLTARHVVDGCTQVGLSVGDGRMVRVNDVRTSPDSDLALLITERAPTSLQLDLDRELRVGDEGYHVGFPQGRSGEASSRLLERSNLQTSGRYRMEEHVLAWVETNRTQGVDGTLSGMSGGPVFDSQGSVIGVTVAESPRRARIYTAAPDSIRSFLEDQGVMAPGGTARPLASSSYSSEADRLRRERAVVKVLCRVGEI